VFGQYRKMNWKLYSAVWKWKPAFVYPNKHLLAWGPRYGLCGLVKGACGRVHRGKAKVYGAQTRDFWSLVLGPQSIKVGPRTLEPMPRSSVPRVGPIKDKQGYQCPCLDIQHSTLGPSSRSRSTKVGFEILVLVPRSLIFEPRTREYSTLELDGLGH